MKKLNLEDDSSESQSSNEPPSPDSESSAESESSNDPPTPDSESDDSELTVHAPKSGKKVGATAVDWTAQGKVTAVRNQGSCGSCWAFSAAAAIEAAYLLKSGTTLDLSEQQLVDCTYDYWTGSNG